MSAEKRPEPSLGARVTDAGVVFGLYAEPAEHCAVQLFEPSGQPRAVYELHSLGQGYFVGEVPGAGPGTRYKFIVDGTSWPDPYARSAPDGVHAPAEVVASRYDWKHQRVAPKPLSEQVIYELHVGTFTPQGTYAAAREKLAYLANLGVTAIELMPLSSFAGQRGWGYDGVMHFAPFAPYGAPDELRRLVDEAHGLGLAVLLDVVYNHFGPSGNYLGVYSQGYFTSEFTNAWGQAPAFRHPVMRRYARENALYWLEEFRFDGLRLDAIHAIFDDSETHIVREICSAVHERFPGCFVIAEDERNEPADVTELGCDAVWADDFHHHVRVTLTREQEGYYGGYEPGAAGLVRAIERGWSYEGQLYPPSGKVRGKSAAAIPAHGFVYCIQNHDQIGNRALGTRLCHVTDWDGYCLASTILLFLPMTPLVFMGQEWGASAPFLFFSDHDAELGPKVTAGRRHEFSSFSAFSNPEEQEKIPDPQAQSTFEASKLDWRERSEGPHARVEKLYRQLLALRREDPVFRATRSRANLSVFALGDVLVLKRFHEQLGERILLANFGLEAVSLATLPLPSAPWQLMLATKAPVGDNLLPRAAIVFGSELASGQGSTIGPRDSRNDSETVGGY